MPNFAFDALRTISLTWTVLIVRCEVLKTARDSVVDDLNCSSSLVIEIHIYPYTTRFKRKILSTSCTSTRYQIFLIENMGRPSKLNTTYYKMTIIILLFLSFTAIVYVVDYLTSLRVYTIVISYMCLSIYKSILTVLYTVSGDAFLTGSIEKFFNRSWLFKHR